MLSLLSTLNQSLKTKSNVVLTNNHLLPDNVFAQTPSRVDGFDADIEADLRIHGCELIQTAGMLLKLPQSVMANGQIYLQRFYYAKSFLRYQVEHMAMGCIYLASKVEEHPRTILDVINVFYHMKQIRRQEVIKPIVDVKVIAQLKEEVIIAEARVLKQLGFCVHNKLPYKLILVYLQVLTYEKNKMLMQTSWNYMNDAFRTEVVVRYPSEAIACACIYLAARKIGLPMPKKPHWFLIFKVDEATIRDISSCILVLYTRAKVDFKEIEKKVGQIKMSHANKIIAQNGKAILKPNTINQEAEKNVIEVTQLSKNSLNTKQSINKTKRQKTENYEKERKPHKTDSHSYERNKYYNEQSKMTTSQQIIQRRNKYKLDKDTTDVYRESKKEYYRHMADREYRHRFYRHPREADDRKREYRTIRVK